jgi:hypothetical protein
MSEESGRQVLDFALRNGDYHQATPVWHFGDGGRLGAGFLGHAGQAFRAARVGYHHVVLQTGEMPGETSDERGYDAGKKINGRKRHVLVDTIRL